MNRELSREERLRGLSTIRSLFEAGNQGFCYPLRYVWMVEVGDNVDGGAVTGDVECGCDADDNHPINSILFSVPKRNIRRANKRNLLKRRCRESYRLNKELLKVDGVERSVNIAFIYSTKEVHQYKTISRAVQRVLTQISKALEKGGSSAANTTR